MPKKTTLEIMMEFVQEYLNGKTDRLNFDMYFDDYLTKHYRKMEREYGELADCFKFYLSEEGYEQVQDPMLSDAEHKKRIRKQFREFKSAMRDGIL